MLQSVCPLLHRLAVTTDLRVFARDLLLKRTKEWLFEEET